MMRRKTLTLATALMVSLSTVGQLPEPPSERGGSPVRTGGILYGNGELTSGLTSGNSVRNGQPAPLAPATLLLLGLAAGVGGVKIYRNNQSNQKKGDTK